MGESAGKTPPPLRRVDSLAKIVRRQQDEELEKLRRMEGKTAEKPDGLSERLPLTRGNENRNETKIVEEKGGHFKVTDTDTHVVKIVANEEEVKAVQSQTWIRMKQLIAGGGSGAITKTAVAPLERVKILLQVQGMSVKTSGKRIAAADLKYHGVVGTMKTVTKEEGLLSLYKGNGANVLRVVPVYALKFTFNDTFKDMVRTPGQDLNFGQLIMAGTGAGLFQTCVTYPLDTVRTRLTLGSGLGSQYTGIMDVLRQTLAKEGVRGLYKGIGPTFLSGSPYVGLQMTFYEIFKRKMDNNASTKNTFRTQVEKLLAGAAAGVIAQTITYPGDTVRRRMQLNGMGGKPPEYRHSWDCCMKLVRAEGIAGLFNGLGANLIRALPGAAIQFWAYDLLTAGLKDL